MLENYQRIYYVYLLFGNERIYLQSATATTPAMAKAKVWDSCSPMIKQINPNAKINHLTAELLSDSVINK